MSNTVVNSNKMNDGSEGEIRERTVDDLIRSFKNCGGNYAFLIGAGMSKRAGIDTAYDLIKKWRNECYEYAEPNMDKENWVELMEKDVPKGGEYGFWFQERYPIYEERRRFIRDLVKDSEPKREQIILAALMEGDDAYVPHILTPNFDDLLYDAFYRYFDDRPLLIDHNAIVPQFQLTSSRAAIIQLHGDYLYDNLQNLNTEALRENMEEALKRTLREYGLIVVGYSGRDESIMSVINDDDFEISGHGVYWCTLDADDLSPKAAELLKKPNTYVVEIDGAESLFDRIFERMKSEINPALPEPGEIRSRAESRARELPGKVGEADGTDKSKVEEPTEEEETGDQTTERTEVEELTLEDEIPTELQSVGLRMKADNHRYEGDNEQAVKLYTEAIELDPDDPISYLNRGITRLTLGDYDKAIDDFKEALNLFQEKNDREGEAKSLDNLGVVAYQRGEFNVAEDYHEQSLNIKRDVGDREGEANSLGNLGVVASGQGKLETAEKYYRQSLDIMEEIGNRRGEAKSLGNLGQVAYERGELETAKDYLQRSLEMMREVGDSEGEAKALDNLGEIARKRGELDIAEDYHEQSLSIKRELGDRNGEAYSLGNLGVVACKRGELTTAQEYLEQSLDIMRDVGDQNGEAESLIELGLVKEENGDLEGAKEYFNEAFEKSQEIGAMLTAIKAIEEYINICEEKDSFNEAVEWCEKAIEIADQLDNQDRIEQFQSRREELMDSREDE